MNALAMQTSVHDVLPTHQTMAGVAHDLKLPLSHIKGFVSTLRRDDMSWDEDTRQEFLADIEQEVDRLAHMLDSLMRSQSKTARKPRRTATAPASIANQAVHRTAAILGNRSVRVDVAPDLPRVCVDTSEIERVLVNLLQNAVKYSSPHSPIGISARLHGLDELEFAVENDGPVIPSEEQDHLFEPFFRTRNVAESNVPGHGLGLAICQSIALAHGGRMGVSSRPGKTRFSMYLPLRWTSGTRPAHAMETESE